MSNKIIIHVIIFILGIILMIPSIADIGKEINEEIYQRYSKSDTMTNIYTKRIKQLYFGWYFDNNR